MTLISSSYAFGLIIASASLVTACDTSGDLLDNPDGCFTDFGEFLQVTETGVLAGEATIEAFRFSSNGILSGVTWMERGRTLTGITEPIQLTPEMYQQSLNELSDIALSFPEPDGTVGQRTGVFEFLISNDDGFEGQSGTIGSEFLLPILEQWRALAVFNTPEPGTYYWSHLESNDFDSNRIDIDLVARGCSDQLSVELVNGAIANEVVQPASNELVEFVDPIISTRSRLIGKSDSIGINFSLIYSQ